MGSSGGLPRRLGLFDSAAIVIGTIKAELVPMSVDGKIHVSEQGHLALIRCTTSAVFVFRDDGSKLRESLYFRKKTIEQDGAANGSQPLSSETNRMSSAAGSRR